MRRTGTRSPRGRPKAICRRLPACSGPRCGATFAIRLAGSAWPAFAADLREVQNAETGEPLIADIMMTHEHCRGAYLDRLPDMLVTWNRSAPSDVARSPKIGTVDTRGLLQSRTGDHRPGGRFFAAGDGWPARQLDGTVNAGDFAPTIARLFGASPGLCDGRVIDALAP